MTAIVAIASTPLRETALDSLARSGYAAVCAEPSAIGDLFRAARQPGLRCLVLDAKSAWRAAIDRVQSARAGGPCPVIVLVAERPTRELVLEAARAGVTDVVLNGSEVGAAARRRMARLGLSDPAAPPPAPPAAAPPAPPAATAAATAASAASTGSGKNPGAPAEPAPSATDAAHELSASKPLVSRTHVLDAVDQRATLRALPPVARQVLALAASPNASLEEVAQTVKQDPAICLKILRLANSSAYAGGPRVDSVQKAVSRIGLSQIREAVMNLDILDRFNGVRCGGIRADWFWEHSIAVGLIASRLARHAGATAEAAEAMFTAGLLHDLGRMLLAEVLPDEYAAVVRAADRLELPLETVEARLLMVNHAELTDRVLRTWKFPAELINPIALHHLTVAEGRRAAPRMAEPVAVLGLANRLAHALLIGSSGNEAVYPLREHLRALAVEPAVVDELAAEVPSETSEMRMVLMSRSTETDTTTFDQHLRTRLGAAGPLASISGAPGLDPFDRVVTRLWGEDAEPRAVLVYVHNPHEAHAAAERLREMDERAGRRLPAVVVSPTGAVPLTDGPDPRPARQLACPTPLSRLVRAAEALAHDSPAAAAA